MITKAGLSNNSSSTRSIVEYIFNKFLISHKLIKLY